MARKNPPNPGEKRQQPPDSAVQKKVRSEKDYPARPKSGQEKSLPETRLCLQHNRVGKGT
jgi:hypothetical protein